MKQVKYSCDLCRNTLERIKCIGLFWGGYPEQWSVREPDGCGRHLCKPCAINLRDILSPLDISDD